MQTISSANLKVINIVSRWPGATHDQTIFTESRVRERFHAGDFGQYILVGDSGYANTFFLATPFTANNNDIAENRYMQAYQAAVIATRNVVERQYGVMKRRFPALAYGLRVHIETAQKLISVAAILHNICIDENENVPPVDIDLEDNLLRVPEDPQQPHQNENPRRNRRLARDIILDIFRAQH